MTDFGGILDSLRSSGDDISGFFSGAIGQASARAYLGGSQQAKKERTPQNEGFFAERSLTTNQDAPRVGESTRPAEAEDYNKLEIEWLNRLHRFSGLAGATGTDVKIGGK